MRLPAPAAGPASTPDLRGRAQGRCRVLKWSAPPAGHTTVLRPTPQSSQPQCSAASALTASSPLSGRMFPSTRGPPRAQRQAPGQSGQGEQEDCFRAGAL
ncbi:hypothetical protein NDU88_004266 [Pleurodeles waltl]|uniref:Uncharacterized protein n=1 Tax=Pleurodeles waltl TaxID=8319 RepID=A0AAV7V2J7_PLEWA|nr:hypothetical protein NDU88_004266 [Pleurodeles waltl]